MKYLIAEFGNAHFGDIKRAKELIRISKECGASMAKGQAFVAKDIQGSMPDSFYALCQFTFEEYVELIDYGNDIGIPVFFSIFSREYEPLIYHQQWYKVPASQSKCNFTQVRKKDTNRTIVSIPEMSIKPELTKAHILHVTPYMAKEVNLDHIEWLSKYYERAVGLSCHCLGINEAMLAIKKYDIPILEKHFTLEKELKHAGVVFRDTIHGCLPYELEQLAKELN